MKLLQHKVGTVEVLTPGGALVDEDSELFSAKLLEQVEMGNTRVVVCMQEVGYVDSVALEGLLDAADGLALAASNLKLSNVTPGCREVFELTGISHRFRFFQDVQDAVKSFL